MTWIKAIISGIIASLAMFGVLHVGVNITDIAPFNITPSAAFLYNLGISNSLGALLLHFFYGTFWSVMFVYALEADVSMLKGIYLGLLLWLFMMLVYSPIIGWGIFGFGLANLIDPQHPLYLSSSIQYIIITLILNLIYGSIMGKINAVLIKKK